MAPKNPRGPSLVPAQISEQSDVEDNELCRWKFSNLQPSFVDFVRNEVTQDHLEEYRTYFKIPRDIDLILPGTRAAWNPPEGCVAIYGYMLACGISLPFPSFIARFLASVKLAPMQLTPNGYRNLLGLYCLWMKENKVEPIVNELKHCCIVRPSFGEPGSYFIASPKPNKWMPIGENRERMVGDLDLPVEDKERKNGIIWEISSSNKFWKGSWFFVRGNWGQTVRTDDLDVILSVPRHFCEAVAYSDPPDLSEDEKIRIAKAMQTKMETRRFGSLVTKQKLQEYGLIPKLGSVSSHLRSIDPIYGYLVKRARASKKNSTPGGLGEVTAIDTPEGRRKRKRKTATVVASSRMGKAKAPRALIEIPPSRKDFGASWISKCTKSSAPATHTQESSSLTPGTNQESERTDDVRVQQDFSNSDKNGLIFDNTAIVEFPSMAKESAVEAVGSSQVVGMAQVSTQVHPIDIDLSTSATIVNLFSPGSQTFAPPDSLQSFGQMTLTEQAKTSAYFYSMLIQRCEQVTHERDDLLGRLSIMTIEKDQVLTDNRKLQGELSQTKDDLRVALEERDKASKASETAQTKISILEEQLKEYTENLKQVRKEVEIRAVDLFKQSPAFDAETSYETEVMM